MSTLPSIIVGAGLMGRWHAEAAAHAHAKVIAVVDTDGARAAALAHRHPGAAVFTDLGHALVVVGPGVVHLCTPLATHAPLALDALAAGHHVLVEKPLVDDLATADVLLRAAESARRLVCPVHQFLFQPGALRAAEVLPSLGALLHLEAEVSSTGAEHSVATPDDVALEILPHALSFAARHGGRPITESPWTCRRSTAGEIVVGASLGDTTVTVRLSMRGRPPVNALRFIAERGTIHLDLFNGFALVDRTGTSRMMKLARPALFAARLAGATAVTLAGRVVRAETAYPGLRELVRRFYAAAAGNHPSPIPVEETRAVAVVWDRLRAQVHAAVREGSLAPVGSR